MASQNKRSVFIRNLLVAYFKRRIGNHRFCIISNDCWGAELYKLLDRPYNTPFIGLMLMSPCYIKLLDNLKYYLNEPLNFKSESRYPEMQEIKSGTNFPLATLGNSDIEIHFMHYKSEIEARDKWNRRVKRIDWNNLCVKYDCGKDYASRELAERFMKSNYANRLMFGKNEYEQLEMFLINNYDVNALKQFKNCFLSFDPVGWLLDKPYYKNPIQKLIGSLSFKYL